VRGAIEALTGTHTRITVEVTATRGKETRSIMIPVGPEAGPMLTAWLRLCPGFVFTVAFSECTA